MKNRKGIRAPSSSRHYCNSGDRFGWGHRTHLISRERIAGDRIPARAKPWTIGHLLFMIVDVRRREFEAFQRRHRAGAGLGFRDRSELQLDRVAAHREVRLSAIGSFPDAQGSMQSVRRWSAAHHKGVSSSLLRLQITDCTAGTARDRHELSRQCADAFRGVHKRRSQRCGCGP